MAYAHGVLPSMNTVTRLALAAALSLPLLSCNQGSRSLPDHNGPFEHDVDTHGIAEPPADGDHAPGARGKSPTTARDAATQALAEILTDNTMFVRGHDPSHFVAFEKEQHPRVTVVGCADSRFHTNALENDPDGDIFMVRNIGNQIDSSEGSVEYGIRHLHTPLLLVIGHVGCGAVKAALEDYGDESPPIRHELDGLHLSLRHVMNEPGSFEDRWHDGVIENVHRQVANALREYADLVKSGQLFVVGGVYDFRDELGEGRGRLHILSVNGDRDPHDCPGLFQDALRAAGDPGVPSAP